MTRIDRRDCVLEALGQHGAAHLAPYMTLHEDSEGYDGQPARAEIALGYNDGMRFKTVTSSNVPSLEDALKRLQDKREISTMFCLAAQFIPSDLQPELPAWMHMASKADDILHQMRRVQSLAKSANPEHDGESVF